MFKEKIKKVWNELKLFCIKILSEDNIAQKVGLICLVSSLASCWLNLYNISLVSLIIASLVEIYLRFTNQLTVSKWIHGLFPKNVDMLIMVGLLGLTLLMFGLSSLLPILMGVIISKLFWNE